MLDFIFVLFGGLNLDEVFNLVFIFLSIVLAITFKISKDIDKEWEEEDNSQIIEIFERTPDDKHHI